MSSKRKNSNEIETQDFNKKKIKQENLIHSIFNVNILNLINNLGLIYKKKSNENKEPEVINDFISDADNIVSYNISEYKNLCNQGILSRLNNDADINNKPIIIYENSDFQQLKNFTFLDLIRQKNIESYEKKSNLFIDGVTAFGKTSIIDKSTYKQAKINHYFSFDNYNHNPHEAHLYVAGQIAMNKSGSGYIFDRSPISNIAFQIINYLTKYFDDQNSKNEKSMLTIHGIIDIYLRDSNLLSVLKYIAYHTKNIIVLIDSDIDLSKQRMMNRAISSNGSNGDAIRCLSDNYFILQNMVYSYIAKKCNYVVIDLNYYRNFVVCDGVNWRAHKSDMYNLKSDDDNKDQLIFNFKLLDSAIREGVQKYIDEVGKHTLTEHQYLTMVNTQTIYDINEEYLNIKKISQR